MKGRTGGDLFMFSIYNWISFGPLFVFVALGVMEWIDPPKYKNFVENALQSLLRLGSRTSL
jgi:hypothetical protein